MSNNKNNGSWNWSMPYPNVGDIWINDYDGGKVEVILVDEKEETVGIKYNDFASLVDAFGDEEEAKDVFGSSEEILIESLKQHWHI